MTQKEKQERADEKLKRFRNLTERMALLYENKNADYGDSFGETYRRLGLVSAVTRIQDKCNRLCNLAVNKGRQRVEDESIRDTLVDLANYAIMTLIEMDLEVEEMVEEL